jgi:hypothetical protein
MMCDNSVRIIQSFTVLLFPALEKQTFSKFQREEMQENRRLYFSHHFTSSIFCLPFYGRIGTDKRQARMNLEDWPLDRKL